MSISEIMSRITISSPLPPFCPFIPTYVYRNHAVSREASFSESRRVPSRPEPCLIIVEESNVRHEKESFGI